MSAYSTLFRFAIGLCSDRAELVAFWHSHAAARSMLGIQDGDETFTSLTGFCKEKNATFGGAA